MLLSEDSGKEVDIEFAARDWYEKYGKEFERQWYLKKPEVPQRFPGAREGGPRLTEKAVGLAIPPLKQLLYAGFSITDILGASLGLGLGKTAHHLLIRVVPKEERDKFYVQLIARLAGYELTPEEAEHAWSEILKHKWYLSQRARKDVGSKSAAIDYFKRLKLAEH